MPEGSWLVGVALLRGWLLTYLLHSTIVLGGAWIVTRLVDMRPESRELVWRTALFAGILTSAIAVTTPRTGDLTEVSLARWALGEQVSIERFAFNGVRDTGGAAIGDESIRRSVRVERRIVRSGALASPGGWLVWLWMTGASLGVGWLVWRGRGLFAVRDSLHPPSPRAQRHLTDLVAAVDGGPVPTLRSSASVDSPCVLPGGTIVLAERCDHDLADEELRAVLAHEMAHVRRRDPAWVSRMRVATAVCWIQPLNWVALREMQQATEFACDDRAVAWTGDRVALARSISRIAEWSFASQRPVPGMPMIGRSGGPSGRVRRILATGPDVVEARWRRILVLVAIVLPLHWAPVLGGPTLVRARVFVETDAVVEGTVHVVQVGRATAAERPDTKRR